MTSYRALCGLKKGDLAISFPLEMPLVVDDIMFTVVIYVLRGSILDGKTPMRDESFKIPTPTD